MFCEQGVFTPDDVSRYVGLMTRTWPEIHFEFHGHGDYGLASANCLAAVAAGARGVHTSVNGMGERAGNTRLAEVVAALQLPEAKAALLAQGAEAVPGTPEEFDAHIKREIAKWGKVIRAVGAKPD